LKTLYFIRHAKSSWEFDVSDDKRPLNEKGLHDAGLIGKELKEKITKKLDRILCSPAERAYTTAQIVLDHMDIKEDLFSVEPRLYDFAGGLVTEVIQECDDDINTLMIFGHNHAFTYLANQYGDLVIDNIPTAGVVAIEFDVAQWGNITKGKTIFTLYPKSLR